MNNDTYIAMPNSVAATISGYIESRAKHTKLEDYRVRKLLTGDPEIPTVYHVSGPNGYDAWLVWNPLYKRCTAYHRGTTPAVTSDSEIHIAVEDMKKRPKPRKPSGGDDDNPWQNRLW